MNAARRKEIARIQAELEALVGKVSDLKSELESVRDEEQEYYDNMPESFQNGEKGEAASAAVSSLEEVINALEEFESADFSELENAVQ